MNDGDSAVLITGAAGGIGQATAREFARAGHRVLALDVDPSVLNLGERLGNDRIVGMPVDHRDLAAVEAALDRCNMIDLLRHVVLLAGIALPEETQLSGGRELPHPTPFQASVELNLLGHVNVIWAVQRLLFSADGDRSIAVCS
jgi:NAD(P)-dependent dehydrogenase (short-subunit alcohol dehydrogenase family)